MTNASVALSTAGDSTQPDYGTFSQPFRNGWGDDILPFKVADELHRREVMRPSLETASLDPDQARDGTSAIAGQQLAPRAVQSFLPPVVPAPDRMARPSFVALQEWEGVVTLVADTRFNARLVDLTGGGPDEEGEFSKEELSDDDVALLGPGAIFRWSVGVLRMPGGAKRSTSQIILRRLPVWAERDIQRADALAAEITSGLEKIKLPDSRNK